MCSGVQYLTHIAAWQMYGYGVLSQYSALPITNARVPLGMCPQSAWRPRQPPPHPSPPHEYMRVSGGGEVCGLYPPPWMRTLSVAYGAHVSPTCVLGNRAGASDYMLPVRLHNPHNATLRVVDAVALGKNIGLAIPRNSPHFRWELAPYEVATVVAAVIYAYVKAPGSVGARSMQSKCIKALRLVVGRPMICRAAPQKRVGIGGRVRCALAGARGLWQAAALSYVTIVPE
jgi:hypothetical protein